MTEAVEHRPFDWKPVLYVLTGISLVLLIASFTGSGTGMFGWGFMMATMWIWFLLIVVALVLFGYFLGQQRQRQP